MAEQSRMQLDEVVFKPGGTPGLGYPVTVSADLPYTKKSAPVANAAGVTLTGAQLTAGLIIRSGAAAVNDTLPTATQILAAINQRIQINQVIPLRIINLNSGLLTIITGAGVTLAGVTTVPTLAERYYEVIFSNLNVPTCTFTGIYASVTALFSA